MFYTRRLKKFSVILIIVLLLLLVIIRQLGFWIVNTEKPVKADAIFLLMGDIDDRLPLCIDLYKAGYAPAIVMVEPSDEKKDLPLQKGIQLYSAAENVCDILVQKKIERAAITVLAGPASSTIDEARAMADWCKARPAIKKILVITSTYHTARAGKILKRVFKKNKLDVEFILPFNQYTGYQSGGWYRRKVDRKLTIEETFKTLYYLCWRRWKI
jgi:uncharacterized SAM-binding protein YcdF (DUF218 family)